MSSIFDILFNRKESQLEQSETVELKAQLVALQNRVDDLECVAFEGKAKRRIDSFEDRVDSIDSRIDDLESQLEEKASYDQYSDLDDRIDTLSSTVSDSELEDYNLSDLESKLEGKIEELDHSELDHSVIDRLSKVESFAFVTESSLQAMFLSNPIGYELGTAFLNNSVAHGAPLASQPLAQLESLKCEWIKQAQEKAQEKTQEKTQEKAQEKAQA